MKEKTKGKGSNPSEESFLHPPEGQRNPRYARSQRHEIPKPKGEEILEETRLKKAHVPTARMGKQG